MRKQIDERARKLGLFMIENNSTVRAAAAHFCVSKSTVHKDLTERLQEIDIDLYEQVRDILEQNKAERHIRGGMATKLKYQKTDHT